MGHGQRSLSRYSSLILCKGRRSNAHGALHQLWRVVDSPKPWRCECCCLGAKHSVNTRGLSIRNIEANSKESTKNEKLCKHTTIPYTWLHVVSFGPLFGMLLCLLDGVLKPCSIGPLEASFLQLTFPGCTTVRRVSGAPAKGCAAPCPNEMMPIFPYYCRLLDELS